MFGQSLGKFIHNGNGELSSERKKVKEGYTLPETKMAPEDRLSQKETSTVFQPSVCGCYVSFREG